MGPRAGVFCHNGLGDGINCLVLSNTLQLNGWKVDTYQNTIGSMQSWFPHLPVQSYPSLEELPRILGSYDWFFVVQNTTDSFVQQLISEGKRRFPDRLKVLYFYPSPHIVNEPYYADCLTEFDLSIAENLRLFCERILHLPRIAKNSGLIPPSSLVHRKHKKRVVIHPTSARLSRSWPREQFVKLALHLSELGYEVSFIPGGAKEKENWKEVEELGFSIPLFSSLDGLASFIYESGFFVGNDSGPGHLASALQIPTLTFCRSKRLADLWAPSFSKGVVLTPNPWIPNWKGLRFRDRYWKYCISLAKARRGFEKLQQLVAGGRG
ncbi:MAG: glycosyltransferase family 9 protein [Verrucomicrobiota bacterium]|nr:glycosyltransferase family 9 protein [Verrucomicrobiota bacterium]